MSAFGRFRRAQRDLHAGRSIDVQSASALAHIVDVFDASRQWRGKDWIAYFPSPLTATSVSVMMGEAITVEEIIDLTIEMEATLQFA